METKREGEGRRTGRAQLSIWVASHFNRLREIVSDKEVELAVLPLLFTQGPIYSFALAQHKREGETWTTTSYNDIIIGDVTKPSGIHKVVSSVLWLVDWAETEYRPWFEQILTRRYTEN
jgi:hypothetical protein